MLTMRISRFRRQAQPIAIRVSNTQARQPHSNEHLVRILSRIKTPQCLQPAHFACADMMLLLHLEHQAGFRQRGALIAD